MIFGPKYYLGDQIKDMMGGARGIQGKQEKRMQRFLLEHLKERKHLEDLSIDEKIVIK